jgi:hypothetical protein
MMTAVTAKAYGSDGFLVTKAEHWQNFAFIVKEIKKFLAGLASAYRTDLMAKYSLHGMLWSHDSLR